jgi:hypothetical protein
MKKRSGQPAMNRSKNKAGMGIKALAVLLVGLVLASVQPAEAQQAGKVPRIGLLRAGSPPDPYVEAFTQGLRELGVRSCAWIGCSLDVQEQGLIWRAEIKADHIVELFDKTFVAAELESLGQ